MAFQIIAGALAPILLKSGAKILHGVIRSKFGNGPAKVVEDIAEALNVEPNVAAIERAYKEAPALTSQKIRDVEQTNMQYWAEILSVEREMLETQHKTIRQEMKSSGILSRTWRPFVGYGYGLANVVLVFTICFVLLSGNFAVIDAMAGLWGPLGAILATWAGVTGTYVHARSREKRADKA